MLQHLEKPASTRGTLLAAPCLAGAPWLPLGQGFKAFVQSCGRGKLQFTLCPVFPSCLGCQSWCLGDRFQGSGLHLDFLHSSGLTLLKAGGRERAEAAFPSLSGLVPKEHTVQDYTEGSFVSTWHLNWYRETKGGSALKIHLYIKGKSRSHWNCLQQVERIIRRTNIVLTDIQMAFAGKSQRL